jgi:hypothetical protein
VVTGLDDKCSNRELGTPVGVQNDAENRVIPLRRLRCPFGDYSNFWLPENQVSYRQCMTISKIASQLRMVLGVCVEADTKVSPAQRIYFAAAQSECSDEEIISIWLSASSLKENQVPLFVAKHWVKHASNFIERMALLEHNTTSPGNN